MIEIKVEGERLADGTKYPDTLLHSEAFGDSRNPMVMVLHGGPGGDYRSLLPLEPLADDGYYVVFWDQRGAGLSRRHSPDTYSFNLYLEDLRQVIEYYSRGAPDGPIVFIGHSWGGMYATWFINEYGDYGGRIQGNIVSEAGGFTDIELEEYMEEHLGSMEFFSEQTNDIAWLDQFITADDHASLDYKHMLWAAGGTPSEHIDPDNPAPRWRAGAVVNQKLLELALEEGFDWTTNLCLFNHRVLFLRGELNGTMTLEHQTNLASYY
ncbi:MAG: alpha/beta hydrolase, partial [Planctomycetota bacterium]